MTSVHIETAAAISLITPVKIIGAAYLGRPRFSEANLSGVAQTVTELIRISAEQRSMAVHQLQRYSANRQSCINLSKCALRTLGLCTCC